jgi:hypothetical protein
MAIASTQVLGMAHPSGASSCFRVARRLSLNAREAAFAHVLHVVSFRTTCEDCLASSDGRICSESTDRSCDLADY